MFADDINHISPTPHPLFPTHSMLYYNFEQSATKANTKAKGDLKKHEYTIQPHPIPGILQIPQRTRLQHPQSLQD